MAEETRKDTPATDPKAAGKSGPVRPPVLEGTARPAGPDMPGEKLSARADTSKTEKPAGKPAASAASPAAARPSPVPKDTGKGDAGSGTAWLAGIVGGVIGLGAAYGLAWFGLWPATQQAEAPADPRLAQFATAIPELETVTNTVQDELSTLTGRVGALETAQADLAATPAASPQPAETDPAVTEQLAALQARLDELSAASTDSGSAETLAAMRAELDSLKAETETAATQLAETRQQLATLSQSASDNAGAEAATIRLPLIFSGLDSAFDSGRPYDTELAALRQALPQHTVPEAIAAHAADGLPRPETIASQLAAVMPDILAGRPARADAGWQDATADWFRGLIAMRPSGAVEGNSADAVVARLEAAVARRDFVAAAAELAALPDFMRRAAGSVAADIESLAAAQTFLARLRAEALNVEAGA